MPLVSGSVASRTGGPGSVRVAVHGAVARPLAERLRGRPLCSPGARVHTATSVLLSPERSQESTAVALSDSSSTQDLFSEPASSLEGSQKPYTEKRPPAPSSQVGPPGKDLQGAAEERGTET